jgi:ABC-2 type transport system permease protein
MVNAFRYGFLGISDVSVPLAFSILIGLTVVLFGICLWMFKKGTGLKN